MREKIKRFFSENKLKTLLQGLFVIVVFFFLLKALFSNWNKIDVDFAVVNYYLLALSFSLFVLALTGYALCWREAVSYLGNPIGVKKAIKLWYCSQAARYVPGSVWQIFGRIYLGGKEGISRGKIVASIAIETWLLIISSVIVFGFSLIWGASYLPVTRYWPYFLVSASFFVFLYPKVFNKASDFLVHRFDKDASFKLNLPFGEIIKLLAYYIIVWLLFGVAFYSLLSALKPVSGSLLPIFTGFFALSWVLGFLFVIAPGGLGARELVLVFLLTPYLGGAGALLAAVLSRVVMIIAETAILAVSSRF